MAAGQRYGRLVAVAFVDQARPGLLVRWTFQCDCGRTKTIRVVHVRAGKIQSCGCMKVTALGMSKSPEYHTWSEMRHRCRNSRHHAYKNYGGRGIKVCERWQTFENFYADMGPRPSAEHSIDRIDNDGNYEPGNCRWATETEQKRNRRDNHFIEVDGVRMTIAEAAERAGVCHATLSARVRRRA